MDSRRILLRTSFDTTSCSILSLAIGLPPCGPGLGVLAHRRGLSFSDSLILAKFCLLSNIVNTLTILTCYNWVVGKIQEVVKIGAQLREAREQALLTQEELAARAGVQPFTISRIETDKVEPRFSTIRKLAKALDMDPRALTRRES